MRRSLYGFGSILYKEFLHIQRDRTTLIFALVTPMIQLIIFGFAINFDVRHVATVVVDMDRSRESRAYISALDNTHYLQVIGYLDSPDEAKRALQRNDARVAVIIPPEFARSVESGVNPTVGVLVDGSDSQVSTPAQAAFFKPVPVAKLEDDRSDDADLKGIVEARIDVLFNPQSKTVIYTIPGLVAVVLQMITVTLTSFSLVREREQGTLEQLMVSPVGKLALILGKLIPYCGIALFELVAVLTLGHFVFGVNIAGNPALLLLLSLPFILASLSMGLVISTFAQNQAQALQMALLFVMPSVLLSGYIAPRDTQPGALMIISDCLPVTYFIQIMRGVVVRGAGLSELMPSVLALLAITAVLLALATARFRKTLV